MDDWACTAGKTEWKVEPCSYHYLRYTSNFMHTCHSEYLDCGTDLLIWKFCAHKHSMRCHTHVVRIVCMVKSKYIPDLMNEHQTRCDRMDVFPSL